MKVVMMIVFGCGLISAQAQEFCVDKIYDAIISSEQRELNLKEQLLTAAPTNNYDLKYHRIHWNVSPDTLFVSGDIFSFFELTGNANDIYFDMNDSLVVDSVLMHNEQISFDQNNNAVQLFFSS